MDQISRGFIGLIRLYQDEFIAAGSGRHRITAAALHQCPGRRTDGHITIFMTERVVDIFEPVEIHKQYQQFPMIPF